MLIHPTNSWFKSFMIGARSLCIESTSRDVPTTPRAGAWLRLNPSDTWTFFSRFFRAPRTSLNRSEPLMVSPSGVACGTDWLFRCRDLARRRRRALSSNPGPKSSDTPCGTHIDPRLAQLEHTSDSSDGKMQRTFRRRPAARQGQCQRHSDKRRNIQYSHAVQLRVPFLICRF